MMPHFNKIKTFWILLLVSCLTGCGVSQVVPDRYGRPLSITESAYTSKGCIQKLKESARKLEIKINNVVIDNSTVKILLWPFVKGTTCMADVE
jgi:hypothetical protein